MQISREEILETIRMVQLENLDIRTVTLGISLADCAGVSARQIGKKIRRKMLKYAKNLVSTANTVQDRYGIPIVNKRIAVSPLSNVAENCSSAEFVYLAGVLDEVAAEVGVDFVGGFSALVHKGYTKGDLALMNAIPEALARTSRVCSSINAASTKSGINMNAVALLGQIIKQAAEKTKKHNSLGCCKLVVFANAPDDNPFMAGAFHGFGEPEVVINTGVSGPGVIRSVLEKMPEDADLGKVAEEIKKTAFKITRMGELIGREVAEKLKIEFGIVDVSLAPTPKPGDSVGEILQLMGIEKIGTHGTTAALALLTDAIKKGGAFASSYIGGLSGAFIPVSEDSEMISAVKAGALSLDKLEAMTSVCSVGLDMVAVPGSTSAETISAIIADELAIGVVNNKTTGVRIIPVAGKKKGDWVNWGGLLGGSYILGVNKFSSAKFIRRKGRIPAPIKGLTN